MNFDSGRIWLDPQAPGAQQAALEVVMLGHCVGEADLNQLFARAQVINELNELGYSATLQELRDLSLNFSPLYNVPIPVYSLAEFVTLFPNAQAPAVYRSALAGNEAWLPQAVADFFRFNRTAVFKKCWVINIDQTLAQQGFLPDNTDTVLDANNSNGFNRALALPHAGLMVLPDLERLQIPANIAPRPRLRIANPLPTFLPCSSNNDDGVLERRPAGEYTEQTEPESFARLLQPMLAAINRFRPDMRLLISLPLDVSLESDVPQASHAALGELNQLQKSSWQAQLHRVQIVFPYLRERTGLLKTACGLLAGMIATTVASKGAWRSIAGEPLGGAYQPFPEVSQSSIAQFRDQFGLGVLRFRNQQLQLDDERLLAGVFNDAAEHARSGEISRFLGWLYRQLTELGHNLVFRTDPNEPQALIALNTFFTHLHQLVALRGKRPEEAFYIEQTVADSDPSTVIFIIQIAPAFPIDRIRITLQQDKLEVRGE